MVFIRASGLTQDEIGGFYLWPPVAAPISKDNGVACGCPEEHGGKGGAQEGVVRENYKANQRNRQLRVRNYGTLD